MKYSDKLNIPINWKPCFILQNFSGGFNDDESVLGFASWDELNRFLHYNTRVLKGSFSAICELAYFLSFFKYFCNASILKLISTEFKVEDLIRT